MTHLEDDHATSACSRGAFVKMAGVEWLGQAGRVIQLKGKKMGIREIDQMMGICADLVREAADLVEPHDPADIEAFAYQLCGLEGLGRDELRERLRGVEIPGDFRHLRLYNLTNGMPWGGRYSMHQSRLEIDELIIIMCCVMGRDDVTPQGHGVWTETIALPVRDPGVLELGLRFRPLQ